MFMAKIVIVMTVTKMTIKRISAITAIFLQLFKEYLIAGIRLPCLMLIIVIAATWMKLVIRIKLIIVIKAIVKRILIMRKILMY